MNPRVGLNSTLSWKDPANYGMDRVHEYALLAESGVRWVRLNISWGWSEPSKGTLNTTYHAQLDSVVRTLTSMGVSILFCSNGSPSWAGGKNVPPTNPADHAAWLVQMAARYPVVRHWEVWNEENGAKFWGGRTPNAAEYVRLLRPCYEALKHFDPALTVLMGGLAQGGGALEPIAYLKAMYTAGVKGYFDVAAFHPYCGKRSPETLASRDAFSCAKAFHDVMVANGDTKPVWLTEMGYSTYSSTYGVSLTTQADYLKRAYKLAATWLWCERMFWWCLRPGAKPSAYSSTNFEQNIGVLKLDYAKKPAFAALRAVAGA